MSRIGKKPVSVPSSVKVAIKGQEVSLSGPKGALAWTAPNRVAVKQDGTTLVVTRVDDEKQSRALHGLTRALLANMVKGVAEGYEQKLEIYGTGYSCKIQGTQLHLNLGFMGRGVGKPAQFMIDIPKGLTIEIEAPQARGENEPAKFTVRGPDKQMVGQFSAEVRKLRKPEPYKGKGVRYSGEYVRRKAGKVFAGGGAG
ncbi:MAG: 50S ribosomal protein L6 [Phycisphaerales bacterium]|nr:50S ribosomal protein L6 [Phycisphaerales bacterium]